MGSKTVPCRPRRSARLVVAGLILAGWSGSVAAGIPALADPDPAPAPAPAPAPVPSSSQAPAPAPAGAPKAAIDHDGIFVVGKDIAPGIYSSAGPVGNGTCSWRRSANPDGALIDNAISKKAQVVQIEPTDKTFKSSGCQPWLLTPDAPIADVPGPAAGAQLQTGLGILNGLLGQNGQHVPQP